MIAHSIIQKLIHFNKIFYLLLVTLSNLPSNTKWIIGNIRQYGYYRMNYDEETWQNIIQQLSSNHQVNAIVQNYNYLHDIITIQKN